MLVVGVGTFIAVVYCISWFEHSFCFYACFYDTLLSTSWYPSQASYIDDLQSFYRYSNHYPPRADIISILMSVFSFDGVPLLASLFAFRLTGYRLVFHRSGANVRLEESQNSS